MYPTTNPGDGRVIVRRARGEADITDKTWVNKTAPEMTDAEVDDARATFDKIGGSDYEGEWLRRHNLPDDLLYT